jgi:hypothetical protein
MTGWILAGVAWTLFSLAACIVIGSAIRMADEKEGTR